MTTRREREAMEDAIMDGRTASIARAAWQARMAREAAARRDRMQRWQAEMARMRGDDDDEDEEEADAMPKKRRKPSEAHYGSKKRRAPARKRKSRS